MEKSSQSTTALFTEVGLLIKSRMQKAIPLPFAQCQTLGYVAEHAHPSMQDVARHLKIQAPSATFLVDELVRGGYLERRGNTKDRRRVELLLTAKGRRSFKLIKQKRENILNTLFNALAEKDRKELNRILEKVIKSD